MKSQNKTATVLKNISFVLALSALWSCSINKNAVNKTDSASAGNVYSSSMPLANCNQANSSDMSISLAAILNQNNVADYNTVKLRINYLSTTATADGNIIKFFKWRMNGSQAVLDQTPLSATYYQVSNNQSSAQAYQAFTANQISPDYAFQVNLNDSMGLSQVIKVVIYSSTGSVVAQSNILIPQFSSSPTDYQYNSDGTTRPATLQALHPLQGQSVSNWTATQYNTYFNQFCF